MDAQSQINIQKICPGGDIVLIVGDKWESKSKLLVSSTIMCNTSAVFKAMLGSNFREGQATRSPYFAQEIPLPEDSPQGVGDMCGLLHHNMDCVHRGTWTAERLYELVTTVDKYGCVELLRLQAQALIHQFLGRSASEVSIDDLIRMTAASYLMEDGPCFKFATRRLILMVKGSFSAQQQADTNNFLPARALLALSVQRAKARDLLSINLRLLRISKSCLQGCQTYDNLFLSNLCKQFKVECWPPEFESTLSIDSAIKVLRKSKGIECWNKPCRHLPAKGTVSKGELRAIAAEVDDYCEGLCLKCVKEDRCMEGPCEIKEHR